MIADYPIVTVIVPFHNVERYAAECLNSICSQTLKEIEIICVDDGSTDGTASILREYAVKDSRVTVLRQSNKGAGSARNVGLSIAKGKYLSILDSDDFFEKTMLESAVTKAELYNLDIVLFRSNQYIDNTKTFINASWAIKEEQIPASNSFSFENILANRFIAFQGWAWDKLFRHDLIKRFNLQFQEQKIYNDMFFVFSACMIADRIGYIDYVFAHQRKRGGGSLSDNSSPYWKCLLSALSKTAQYILLSRQSQNIVSDFSNYIQRMIDRQLSISQEDDLIKLKTESNIWLQGLPVEFSSLIGGW